MPEAKPEQLQLTEDILKINNVTDNLGVPSQIFEMVKHSKLQRILSL